jgi:hypothetical protein
VLNTKGDEQAHVVFEVLAVALITPEQSISHCPLVSSNLNGALHEQVVFVNFTMAIGINVQFI